MRQFVRLEWPQTCRRERTVMAGRLYPFVWTKTADEILASIARFAQRTLNARALNLVREPQ